MDVLTKDQLWRCFLKDCNANQRKTLQDMPDPETNGRQMTACVLFVALVAIVMLAMLWGLP
mgnify:CR=1 FL=1